MSFFGDVADFESFNFGKMFQDLGENPERALYGSADPFSTSMWNGILGTDNKPLVDQWGGAAPQRYQEAQDAGINTGPGASMHSVARTIASFYAGGAAGNALGGASSAGSSGAAGMGGGTGITAGGSTSGISGASTGSLGSMGGGTGVGYGAGGASSSAGLFGSGSTAAAQSPGWMSQIKDGYAQVKPYSDAVQTGLKVSKQLEGEPTPALPPPQLTPVTSNQELSGILAQMQQKNALTSQEAQQRKMARRNLLGGQ